MDFFVLKNVCDIVKRFVAVLYTLMSNYDMAIGVTGNKYTKCAISNSGRQHAQFAQ